MTVITKTVGRLPLNKGDWEASYVNPETGLDGYGKKFRVIRYGCELESKMENNTYDPIAWDGAESFTIDDAHWLLVSGNPQEWLASQDKPATTGTTGDYPYNGMGRVVLKKHIVEVGGVEKNLLYQDDFKKGPVGARVDNENTVFIIKYDFDLAEDIIIPAGCVLEFDGGSIVGTGTITGTNTVIKAGNYQIFATGTVKYRGYTIDGSYRYATKVYGDDINIAGTWNNEHVEPAWVGLDNVSPTEESAVKLQRFINLHSEDAVVNVPNNTYYVYVPIIADKAIDFNCGTLKMCKFSDIYDATIDLPSGSESLPAEDIYGLESVYGSLTIRNNGSFVRNVTIDGNKANNAEKIRLGVTGLMHAVVDNYLFENVIIQNSMNNGIIGGRITNSVFDHCAIKETSEHGFYTGGTAKDTITFNNCKFYNCGNSVATATLREGSSYVIKGIIQVADPSMEDGSDFSLTFNDCVFGVNSAAKTGTFNIEAGKLTLNRCILARNTNVFGVERSDNVFRHVDIELNDCENGLAHNATWLNAFVVYNRCRGVVTLTKGIELNNCDMTSVYEGAAYEFDPNGIKVFYTEDYNVHDVATLRISRSRVVFRNNGSSVTSIPIPVVVDSSVLLDDNNEPDLREAPLIKNVDFTITNSKVVLQRLVLYRSDSQTITLNNVVLLGHNQYFIRKAASVVIDTILCLDGNLYYGTVSPPITDNTKRTLRIVSGSDASRSQGYNYAGILTNIVDSDGMLNNYNNCADGAQAVMTFSYGGITRSQLVIDKEKNWLDVYGRTAGEVRGKTSRRPTNLNGTTDAGFMFFDTDLGKPIWWNGTAWVDALGNEVSTIYQKEVTGTNGNFAGFNAQGKLADSGSKPGDFEPASQNT